MNTAPHPMSTRLVVIILALLLGLQPVTTDLYLPALPALREDFNASMTQTQLTLTALLLAFGLSQLVWGPLSDRFGRRPILLSGLSLFTLASVIVLFAPTMTWLIAGRVVQGVAMGAAVMCARALVRDLYEPVKGANAMSKGLSGLGMIACLSAPLGGLLSDWFGWRVALLSLAVFGAGTLWLVATTFQETLPRKDLAALQVGRLAKRWAEIACNPTFWTYTALSTASYGGLFTFLAASSFVFIQILALSKTQYGLLMFSMSAVYIVGTLGCRRLLPRWGVRKSVAAAGGVSLLGGTLMLVLTHSGWHSTWAIMLPYYLFMLAHGVHQPCSQSGAVGPFPHAAGTASALCGFAMMVAAFVMGGWLGSHMDDTVFPMVHGIFFWSACIAFIALVLVRRYGEPQRVKAAA